MSDSAFYAILIAVAAFSFGIGALAMWVHLRARDDVAELLERERCERRRAAW